MLVFPFPARRHWLISFWLTASFVAAVLTSAALVLAFSTGWFFSAILLAAGFALLGRLYSGLALLAYRAWNKIARLVACGLRFLLMALCYFTIFVAVRFQPGTPRFLRLNRAKPSESMWASRGTLAAQDYLHPYLGGTDHSHEATWIANFINSIVSSRDLWAFSLVPVLILLSLLETDAEQTHFPSDIYTLF